MFIQMGKRRWYPEGPVGSIGPEKGSYNKPSLIQMSDNPGQNIKNAHQN
jgi:hypothetical protein